MHFKLKTPSGIDRTEVKLIKQSVATYAEAEREASVEQDRLYAEERTLASKRSKGENMYL